MAFWSTPKQGEDPKRAFRFRLSIGSLGFVWYAKTVDRPSFTVETGEHKFLNHTFYYPGHVNWTEVTATLVDPTEPDAAKLLNQIVELSGYGPPNSELDQTTIGKYAGTQALGSVRIEMLPASGNSNLMGGRDAQDAPDAIETWELRNAFITGITHSQLDYSSEDLSTIEVKFRYDWAECITADGTDIYEGP
jgi:hypothetical protein